VQDVFKLLGRVIRNPPGTVLDSATKEQLVQLSGLAVLWDAAYERGAGKGTDMDRSTPVLGPLMLFDTIMVDPMLAICVATAVELFGPDFTLRDVEELYRVKTPVRPAQFQECGFAGGELTDAGIDVRAGLVAHIARGVGMLQDLFQPTTDAGRDNLKAMVDTGTTATMVFGPTLALSRPGDSAEFEEPTFGVFKKDGRTTTSLQFNRRPRSYECGMGLSVVFTTPPVVLFAANAEVVHMEVMTDAGAWERLKAAATETAAAWAEREWAYPTAWLVVTAFVDFGADGHNRAVAVGTAAKVMWPAFRACFATDAHGRALTAGARRHRGLDDDGTLFPYAGGSFERVVRGAILGCTTVGHVERMSACAALGRYLCDNSQFLKITTLALSQYAFAADTTKKELLPSHADALLMYTSLGYDPFVCQFYWPYGSDKDAQPMARVASILVATLEVCVADEDGDFDFSGVEATEACDATTGKTTVTVQWGGARAVMKASAFDGLRGVITAMYEAANDLLSQRSQRSPPAPAR
jgi:hypothetical protein